MKVQTPQRKFFKKITVKCDLCRIYQTEYPHLSKMICNKCYTINSNICNGLYEKNYKL
jgi:hypothetical protein